MPSPTGISRRVQQAIAQFQGRDWEGALVNLFPALDKTAKKRRPKDSVGSRIRAFLEDEQGLLSFIATGNYIGGIQVDGVSIPDALYKFGRTSIAHEGELDPRLNFNEEGRLAADQESWDLPVAYILAMTIAVIVAPENSQEHLSAELVVTVFGEKFLVNEIWGERAKIRAIIATKFNNPSLFER